MNLLKYLHLGDLPVPVATLGHEEAAECIQMLIAVVPGFVQKTFI